MGAYIQRLYPDNHPPSPPLLWTGSLTYTNLPGVVSEDFLIYWCCVYVSAFVFDDVTNLGLRLFQYSRDREVVGMTRNVCSST